MAKCKICNNLTIGNKSICNKVHLFRCPICGCLFYENEFNNIDYNHFELDYENEDCIVLKFSGEDDLIYDYACFDCSELDLIKNKENYLYPDPIEVSIKLKNYVNSDSFNIPKQKSIKNKNMKEFSVFKETINNIPTELIINNPEKPIHKVYKFLTADALNIKTHLVFPKQVIISKNFLSTMFALYLYYNDIEFEYESLKFNFYYNSVEHIYFPDFYLPEFNYIAEIKDYCGIDNRFNNVFDVIKEKGYLVEVITDLEYIFQWLIVNTQINLINLKTNSQNSNKDIYKFIVPKI